MGNVFGGHLILTNRDTEPGLLEVLCGSHVLYGVYSVVSPDI